MHLNFSYHWSPGLAHLQTCYTSTSLSSVLSSISCSVTPVPQRTLQQDIFHVQSMLNLMQEGGNGIPTKCELQQISQSVDSSPIKFKKLCYNTSIESSNREKVRNYMYSVETIIRKFVMKKKKKDCVYTCRTRIRYEILSITDVTSYHKKLSHGCSI